ncbi:MAG: copper resistance protein CopC, partial [Pedococcus sp.]
MTRHKVTRPRLARRLVLSVVLVALAAVLLPGAGPASAHSYLVSSNPADGQVLDTAPTELRLRLSESVLLGSTSVTIVGGSVRHELTDLRLVEAGSPGDPGGAGGAGVAGGAGAQEAPVELVATLPP